MKVCSRLVLVAAVCLGTLTASTATTGQASTLELMPVPRQLDLGQGALTVTADLTVSVTGDGATPRLQEGVRRMLRRLSDRTGLFFPPATFLQLTGGEAAVVTVHAGRAGEVKLGEDESYRLQVTATGVDIDAETDIGALRGLQTLLQLINRGGGKVVLPVLTIGDAPRFPWRGLMIDSSRHFMPVEVLKRNLDGMAAVKLNVLHWHLCDDQGFRFESLAFPKLQQLGSDGFYYTRAQLAEVIAYATARGIRVVPELDLPGHATSWLVGYPELGSQPGPYQIERGWGIYKPTIDPTREQVYEFLDTLLGEVAAVFPDAFVHIGGDENTGEHWAANPNIQAFMAEHGFADTHALQQYFSQRMQKILAGHGKRMVGWDEILQPELPTSIVIQSWRGREALYQAAQGGYSGILSNGYYIDLIQPTSFHYLNDPMPEDAPISAEESRRVLGGEATMWAEFVTPETVDSRIWPRTAAIAERLWSPGSVRDLDDMYRRLDRISLMLEELGLQHEKNREMMLRRLCGCRDLEALQVLVGAIEPVKIYRRGRLRAYTSFSPLTRLVDAAWPDAGPARRFRRSVERLLDGDLSESAEVRAALQLWQGNHAVVAPILADSPALAEMTSLSRDLEAVATIGLEALDALTNETEKDAEWLAQQLSVMEAAREPRGEAELMVVDPVRDLACRAAGPAAETVTGCQDEEPGEGGGH
jgi:hexosaminidase